MNFCGLDYNTNKRINERSLKESKESEKDKNLNDDILEWNDKDDQSSN